MTDSLTTPAAVTHAERLTHALMLESDSLPSLLHESDRAVTVALALMLANASTTLAGEQSEPTSPTEVLSMLGAASSELVRAHNRQEKVDG